VRFLIDTNLPKSLTAWFRARGHQAEHVLDLNLAQARDETLWRRASETSAVIVSKDEDFADMRGKDPEGPAVIWVRTGNGTTPTLLAIFDPLWPAIESRLAAGDRLIEIR
jgi:predicted nuclease of predicted toxin-antitoxin system